MSRILFISLLILPLLASEALADVVVIVRREAEAGGSYVRVCDIARVEGPREQAAEVGRTVLGPTPPKGQSLEISRWEIESRLSEMGVAAPVTFSGNDTVKVFGNGAAHPIAGRADANLQELNPIFNPQSLHFDADAASGAARNPSQARAGAPGADGMPGRAASGTPLDGMEEEARNRIGQAISHYLAARYNRPDIEVESRLLTSTADIPYEAYEVAVVEAVSGRVPGQATLRLAVKDTRDAEPRQVMVSADAQVFAPAPVAARRLLRGEVLSRRDVVVKRVRMEAGKGYFPPNPSVVEGRELKSNVDAGAPLFPAETASTEAVKRGATVAVHTAGQGWLVQSHAVAVDGGMTGDVISIQDAATKKKFKARILGRNKVEALAMQD